VEATVPDGQPAARDRGALASYLWQYMRFADERRRDALRRGGMAELLRQVGREALSVLRRLASPWPLGIAAFCVIACALARQWPRWQRGREKASPAERRWATMHGLLAQMDGRMRVHGLVRRPSETLHQFAARIVQEKPADEGIGPAAGWYVAYSAARYRGPPREDCADTLQAALDRVGPPSRPIMGRLHR
jgi:hypothetical protein